MPGLWEQRLAIATTTMQRGDVVDSWDAWRDAAMQLRAAAQWLQAASDDMHNAFGDRTDLADAGQASFKAAAERASDRAEEADKAATALSSARNAMIKASDDLTNLPVVMDDPGSFSGDPAKTEKENLDAETKHNNKVKEYNAQQNARETAARAAVEQMTQSYAESREVMKEIHGQPDPEVPSSPSTKSTVGGGAGGSGGGGGDDDDTKYGVTTWVPDWWPPKPTTVPPDESWPPPPPPPPPGWPTHEPTTEIGPTHTGPQITGVAQGPSLGPSSVSTPGLGTSSTAAGVGGPGTIGGSVAGGIGAAGMGLLGGAGAISPGSVSGAAVRGVGATPGRAIGAGGKVGSGGVLGKSGTTGRAGAGGTAGRTSGRGGTGRGSGRAGGRAGGAGSRGAGSRGQAGRGAGGRGRNGKDDEHSSERDLFDSEKDWTDDEGMAPPVLD
jgi:hypothetical protein